MKPGWSVLTIVALILVACGAVPTNTAPTAAVPIVLTTTSAPAPTTMPAAEAAMPTSTAQTRVTETIQQSAATPSLSRIDQFPVVYSLPQMDKARVQNDLTYKESEGQKLQMDIYAPADLSGNARLPAVLFVHGDPVREGQNVKNARPLVSWGQIVAASGMIGVTFTWRAPNEPADVEDATPYVRQHAERLQVDPERLGILALSSGAIALLKLGLTDAGMPEYLRCVVVYYGNLTLPLNRLDTLKQPVTAHFPPFLLAIGAKDDNVSPDLTTLFAQQAKAKGMQVEVLEHPTGVHGFDVINDDDQSRAIIQQTIAFLQEHLLASR